MAEQMIISISREFGSGGHEIAEKIAKRFGVRFYDRNMLDEIALQMNMEAGALDQYDEKHKNPFLTRRVGKYSNAMEDIVIEKQFEFLRAKADSGESFVVVGRCAETILKGRENLITVFVLGDKETKLARVMERYDLDEKDAAAKMLRHDKNRKLYHNRYSEIKWGDSRGYDICVNSSRLGVDKTVDMLQKYIVERMKK